MNNENRRRSETHTLEVLLSGLDARESARSAGSPMLVYLADMLVERARQELDKPELRNEGWDGHLLADARPHAG